MKQTLIKKRLILYHVIYIIGILCAATSKLKQRTTETHIIHKHLLLSRVGKEQRWCISGVECVHVA
jgi:hypothetical protein